ncbi:MAG: prenyltransferase/squalene oxidase repeat-containing protein [Planctomycetota bacterium]
MRHLALIGLLLGVPRETAAQEPAPLCEARGTCAAAGDLDGDGDLDLVVGQENEPLTVLVNDGKATFAVANGACGAAEGRVRAVALLDADGDGDLDILVGGVDALTRLWLNDGGLRFVDSSARLPETKLWATAIAVGDLDGDGDPDVVLANFAGPSVVFRNDGARFTHAEAALPRELRMITALALVDLDHDGDLDLLFGQSPDATGRGGRNRAGRNDGHGKFEDATEAWMPSAAQATAALAIADLDGDGQLDLVCANHGLKPKEGARSGVHRGANGRFLNSAPSRYAGEPAVSQAVALGDVDGDGDVDIVFGNDGPEALYLNDGKGYFQASSAVARVEDDTRELLLRDFDGDGDLDFVTVNQDAPVRLYRNAGAGQFGGRAAAADDHGEHGNDTPSNAPPLSAVAAGKYASRALARAAVSEAGARGAINTALRFFADHQDDDGAFHAAAFVGGTVNDPPVQPYHDVGLTALASLCFLAEASHPGGGFYSETVQHSIAWLLAQQQASGAMGPDDAHHGIYDHALATLALAETLALSGDSSLRQPLEKALAYLEDRRNPDGGFRYERASGPSDTSVTAWCALAQIAGNDVGLAMAAGAPARTLAYLRAMTDAETGRTGYLDRGGLSSRFAGEHEKAFPAERSEAMTGAALFVRLALGDDPGEHADMRNSQARCAAALPQTEAPSYFDPYAWMHTAHALSQLGGDEWVKWRRALHAVLVDKQCKRGEVVGSWDPNEPWGSIGGRFATTAFATLALQAEYRFAKLVDPRWRRKVK